MLSEEKNRRLTRVGPGTPMGELLRRYWWPIATHDMATRVPVKRRLLGEDLVLYRDGSGTVGLLAEQCPHRRAALWLGCTESHGLRCGYHGWRFDEQGNCLEQPGEPADSTFKDRIRATAYPTRELGGLVFAYLGPSPAPELPRYDLFVWDDAWRDIGYAELPVDDETTWHVWYQTYRPEGGAPPQPEIPTYEVPLTDSRGEWLRDYVDGQDIVAWITQGAVSDRSKEHLGKSDLGVILLRKLYTEQMQRVAAGQDPLCTVREPHEVIDLPMERDKFGSAVEFRQLWTRESSIRYSPIRDEIHALFGDPEPTWL